MDHSTIGFHDNVLQSGSQSVQETPVNLGLDLSSIVACELLLSSCRDQDVAVGFQNFPVVGFGPWEAHNGAVLLWKRRQRNSGMSQLR